MSRIWIFTQSSVMALSQQALYKLKTRFGKKDDKGKLLTEKQDVFDAKGNLQSINVPNTIVTDNWEGYIEALRVLQNEIRVPWPTELILEPKDLNFDAPSDYDGIRPTPEMNACLGGLYAGNRHEFERLSPDSLLDLALAGQTESL